jgi:hypothetical protein
MEIVMMYLYAYQTTQFYLIVLPFTALCIAISALLLSFTKKSNLISSSYLWACLWLGLSLCFGFIVVDDNLIGTPTNLAMLPFIIGFGLLHSSRWAYRLLFGILLYNIVHAILIEMQVISPLILSYNSVFELLFLTATFTIIIILGSLNAHYSSHIYRVLRIRKQAIEQDIEHTAYLNNTNYYNFIRFQKDLDTQSRDVMSLISDVRHLFLEPIEKKPKEALSKTGKMLSAIDQIVRNIESKAKQWSDAPTKPKLSKIERIKTTTCDESLDRKVLFYVGLLMAFGTIFLIDDSTLFLYVLGLASLAIFFFLSYALYPYKPKWARFFGFFVITCTLIFLHFRFSSLHGTAPILQMTELIFSLFLIYRFGWKRVVFVPVLFVVFSFIEFYLIRQNMMETTILHDPPLPTLVIFFFIIGLSLLLLSNFLKKRLAFFIQQLSEQNKERLLKRDMLWQLKNQHLNHMKQLYKLSDSNSHRLRAPVARVLGLLGLYSELYSVQMIEEEFGKSMTDLINTSLNEIQDEIEQMQQHFELYLEYDKNELISTIN